MLTVFAITFLALIIGTAISLLFFRDDFEMGCSTLCVVTVILSLLGHLYMWASYADTSDDLVTISRFRRQVEVTDIQRLSPIEKTALRKQIAEWNETITTWQSRNETPPLDLFYPDAIMFVPLIEIPAEL